MFTDIDDKRRTRTVHAIQMRLLHDQLQRNHSTMHALISIHTIHTMLENAYNAHNAYNACNTYNKCKPYNLSAPLSEGRQGCENYFISPPLYNRYLWLLS